MAIISAIIITVKGESALIVYTPLWRTMAEQNVTTYTLRFKHGMSHATVQRLQTNMPVSTHTLNKLCAILNCPLQDVAEYIPDQQAEKSRATISLAERVAL